METPPDRGKSVCGYEVKESPIFNYINSCSPIKTVKSLPTGQTFNSLSFSSFSSGFKSPHTVSNQESRWLQRHQHSDLSKLEFSCGNAIKDNVVINTSQIYENSAKPHENYNTGVSLRGTSLELPGEHSKFDELSRGVQYDCGSSHHGSAPCSETHYMSELPNATVQQKAEKVLSESELHLPDVLQISLKKEETVCNWENLIPDDDDLLIFNSPNDNEAFQRLIQKPLEPEKTRFGTSNMSMLPLNDINAMHNMLAFNEESSGEQHKYFLSQVGEANVEQHGQIHDLSGTNFNECMARNLNGNLNDEMTGAPRENLHDVSNWSSSLLSRYDERVPSNNKQLLPINTGHDSSGRVVPGIGLHLNSLATTPKEYKSFKVLPSGRQKINFSCTPPNFNSVRNGKLPLHRSLTPTSFMRDTYTYGTENGFQLAKNASQPSTYLFMEEHNQNSPRRKRKRPEDDKESEGCKRCNCKKSKCLKLYCECFAASIYCIGSCTCQNCFNNPSHEDIVLATRKQIQSRNPVAFALKVARSSDVVREDEPNKIPSSSRHKRGCNCKKSSCLKKYCECYQGGVGCSNNCRCLGCRNIHGIKNGAALVGTDADPEADTSKMIAEDQQTTETQYTAEDNSSSATLAEPLQLSRFSGHLPFQPRSEPPQSALPIVEPASGLHNSQSRSNTLQPQPEVDEHIHSDPEDEMPEIVQGNHTTPVKTVSPNSKRVSPHCFRSSPNRVTGRKLILKSIPSFSSLSQHH